jgi:hypothetical protein
MNAAIAVGILLVVLEIIPLACQATGRNGPEPVPDRVAAED